MINSVCYWRKDFKLSGHEFADNTSSSGFQGLSDNHLTKLAVGKYAQFNIIFSFVSTYVNSCSIFFSLDR